MIDFIHKTHPRARSVKIKVDAHGQVVVVTPPRFPASRISGFVEAHLPWIMKVKAKIDLQRPLRPAQDNLTIFGKTYHKQVIFTNELPVGIMTRGDQLFINTIKGSPTQPSQSEAKQQLERFLKQTAEKYIVPRTHQLAKTMQVTFGRITLRHQKTRWGSCSSQGNLNFNWQLVQYAPEIIDYVIVHELAHRREMNHSQRFWKVVRDFDPQFEQHRRWLRRHGWAEG